ncbi:MAG: aminotransferase class I/II-fold pyridoxal phosphate-dependent enzyme [Phycisphaerales bacterium]|nr:MAG: aminotransferase class I/II-fold pyridoxal phosphate-dependent enzyme [Phycisphaerales bacterium]
MPTTAAVRPFEVRTDDVLRTLDDGGQYKRLHTLLGPMGPVVRMRGEGGADGKDHDVLCFCSNNYLGLANHPEVVEAGVEGLRKYGAGTASVRFICGTFDCHEQLEATIARYMGTESSYSFVSCWTANESLYPTFGEPGDCIISDELNHACIIDGIRLAAIIKKGLHKTVYKHNDLNHLRERLQQARDNPDVTGQVWVVTDGVFSMEGDLADLPAIRTLCDEFEAMLVVDDSHGHGVMGPTGRGTHEHFGMCPPLPSPAPAGEVAAQPTEGASSTFNPALGQVDFFTGTLGKALGGGAGGFIAGSKRGTELTVQRGRPTLFSNALPCTVACSANKAIEILLREPERVRALRDNTAYARQQIKAAGFDVLDSPTAICPIIVHDTAKAIAMSKRLLELGVFVIGFGYPVVPEGHARLRVQISAAHTTEHIDTLVDALKKL